MYEDPVTTGASAAEVVEELLRQLVDARFVLTDREGSVTRWSRPAEALFGWPAPRMLGRPLVETLRLDTDLPESGGQVEATALRKDGHELEVALTLVPVSMSQSLEFNGFLEALEIAAPRGNALAQLQRSHQTVVEWIHAAVSGQAHLEENVLSAGTIVAFRAIGELPPPLPSPEGEPPEGAPAPDGEVPQVADATPGR
jgi:PAS domain S-box-containing protein